MPSKRRFSLITSVVILGLFITSCGIVQPPAAPSEDFINTSVAETVHAQNPATEQPVVTETPAPPADMPTEAPMPTDEPAAPLAVAFVSPDHNAYFWNEILAAPTQLTTTNDVQEALISPDGTRVALIRSSDWVSYSIDLINSDGSGLMTLVNPSAFAALPRPADTVASTPAHVSWVPNANLLAMTTRITYEGPGSTNGETLFLIDAATSAMSALLTIESEWSWDYTYSPDGTKIAISRPEGLDIYNADGSLMIANLITFPFVNTASEYAWIPQPAWSTDSTAMIVAIPPQDPWSLTPTDSKVYQWSTTDASANLNFSTSMTYWPMKFASIAPDLSKLLYLVRTGAAEDNLFALKMVNADGSGMLEVAVSDIYNLPAWSTDSNTFYYHSNTDGAFIATRGSTPVALPAFNQVRNVRWVDSQRFIGAGGSTGSWQLLLGSTVSPAMVIFSTSTGSDQILFTVNR